MSRYAELTNSAATRLLETVKPVEDMTVFLAGAVDRVARRLPTLSPQGLPGASEVIQVHFTLAERLLAAQQDFALRVLAVNAASPVDVATQGEPVTTPTATRV